METVCLHIFLISVVICKNIPDIFNSRKFKISIGLNFWELHGIVIDVQKHTFLFLPFCLLNKNLGEIEQETE